MGVDPTRESRKLRNLIGVQLQTSGLPDSMRVDEAMRFFAAYHGVAPSYHLLYRLGLSEKMNAQYHMLSTGLQRRLALAVALAHNPPVVFLDEPTAGLDVPSRNELHDLMRELQTGGILSFGLANYLFCWDSRNKTRRGHPLLALLALLPYAVGVALL